jgi:hypothetical protein
LKPDSAPGQLNSGQGQVIYRALSPASLTKNAQGAETVVKLARQACEPAKLTWRPTDYLLLRRGPYLVAAGLEESLAHSTKTIEGHFVNLFDPMLSVLSKITLTPGTRLLLFDISTVDSTQPRVLAAAANVLDFKTNSHQVRFVAVGPERTTAAIRLLLPASPQAVKANNDASFPLTQSWDPVHKTVLLQFPNAPAGIQLELNF